MDSENSSRHRPRSTRGKPSTARRSDAFRLRMATKFPSRRELMDAKYMSDDMNNSVALTDYLGKFCSNLSLNETKRLICLSVEDPSHSDLAKYWSAIEDRDSNLGDTSDDDVQDIITCSLVVGTADNKLKAVDATTSSSILNTVIPVDSIADDRLRHRSCILTDEEGETFKGFMRMEFGVAASNGSGFSYDSPLDAASPYGNVRLDSSEVSSGFTSGTSEVAAASVSASVDGSKPSPDAEHYAACSRLGIRRRQNIHQTLRVDEANGRGRKIGRTEVEPTSQQFSKNFYDVDVSSEGRRSILLLSFLLCIAGTLCLFISVSMHVYRLDVIISQFSSDSHDSDLSDSGD